MSTIHHNPAGPTSSHENQQHDHDHAEHQSGGCCGGSGGSESGGGCCGGQGRAHKVVIPTGTSADIASLPTPQLLARLRHGINNIDPRVFELTHEQLDRAFLPEAGVGRWSCRVLIGHLADAELASTHRVRRALGEDNPVLSLWDEDSFIDQGLYTLPAKPAGGAEGDPASLIGGFVAVVHTLRMWSLQYLAEITDAQWSRQAMHPIHGAMSVRLIVAMNTWHLEHHARFLQMKLDKMLGKVIEPEPQAAGKSSGGCGGGGCGCKSGAR